MSDCDKNIILKLEELDRKRLNNLAHDLGIRGYEKQEEKELIENILKKGDKTVLEQLDKSRASFLEEYKDIYLKLFNLDKNVFDLIVFKVKINPIESLKKEKDELIEDIIRENANRKSLNNLIELIDGIIYSYGQLNKADINFLEIVAYRLGKTEACSENEKIEYIKDIIKKYEKKAITKVLSDWNGIYLELIALELTDLSNAAKKLGIKNYDPAKPEELIKEILKKGTKKEIVNALKKWDINTFGSLCSIIGIPLAIITFIIGIIFGLYTLICGDDIKKRWENWQADDVHLIEITTIISSTITTTTVPSTTTTTTIAISYDSFTKEEASRFFSAVKSAPSGTYSENNLPLDFDRNVEIKEGTLKLNADKSISGEMKFSHKKSANIFTLKADDKLARSIYPSDGAGWTEPVTGMEFVWISGGCNEKGCVEGFWMGKDEVTQGQWKKNITGSNSCTVNRGDENPMQDVSWNDIITFINELNKLNDKEKTGKTYRLPKVSEWEYACQNAAGIEHMKDGVTEWCESNEEFKAIMGGDPVSEKPFSCNNSEKALSDYKSWETGFRLASYQTN